VRRIVSLRPVGSAEPEALPADLDDLFRRYAPYVARIAGRMLGQWQDVDDVVQDVFLDAHRGLATVRDGGAIKGWLASITVRKARRRLGRRRLMRWLGLESPLEPLEVPDTSASAETRAYVLAVYRILDGVHPEARIAWIMNKVEDQPLEMVAEVCRCSRATAHRRVQEAQAALEKGLGDGTAR
jgi:RNA polymerase sigma-70 factor (ECF subfamily)